VAALLIAEDIGKPQAFLVERHAVRRLDKQSRLLVQTRMVYRLLDMSFLVLTVENRDGSRTWLMDKAKLSVGGGDVRQDVQVVTSLTETVSLAPDQEEKVVVAFRTPPQGAEHRYTLELLEKDGNRHVKLEDMNL